MEEFTDQVPPGWRPGVASYPFKDYIEKLSIWVQNNGLSTDTRKISGAQMGLKIIGRLKDEAYRVGMGITVENHAGTKLTGVNALSYAGEPANVDAHVPHVKELSKWLSSI